MSAELTSRSTSRQACNFEMQSGLHLLDRHENVQKMSTGSAELDSLIDGMQEGLFYLFYSTPENQLVLDSLLNRLLVGCILPKDGKKHGFESMALLFNNIDYYTDKNKHQLLNPEKIAVIAKYAGIEPKIVFKNLYVQTAYNLEHQITIAQEIAEKIESNPDIRLIAIRDLTKFIVMNNKASYDASNRADDSGTLKKVLSILYQTCVKNKVTMVATGYCNASSSGIVPRPIGGTYLKHIVNVIVNLKPNLNNGYYYTTSSNTGGSSSALYKATMTKHPYQLTPKFTNIYAKRIGKRKDPMLFIFD
jgi:Rad51 protein